MTTSKEQISLMATERFKAQDSFNIFTFKNVLEKEDSPQQLENWANIFSLPGTVITDELLGIDIPEDANT